jgi:hypothetical protein
MVKRLNLTFESDDFKMLKKEKLASDAPNWEEYILQLARVRK